MGIVIKIEEYWAHQNTNRMINPAGKETHLTILYLPLYTAYFPRVMCAFYEKQLKLKVAILKRQISIERQCQLAIQRSQINYTATYRTRQFLLFSFYKVCTPMKSYIYILILYKFWTHSLFMGI